MTFEIWKNLKREIKDVAGRLRRASARRYLHMRPVANLHENNDVEYLQKDTYQRRLKDEPFEATEVAAKRTEVLISSAAVMLTLWLRTSRSRIGNSRVGVLECSASRCCVASSHTLPICCREASSSA